MSTAARAKSFRFCSLLISAILVYTAVLASQNGEAGRADHIIAAYSTSIAHQDSPVQRNISMASESLDGTVIGPGQVFSFNSIVGSGSADRGYLTGRVLYRDKIAYEAGGGICQVSSTLFNAFLRAGVLIKERHRHYQPVSYVPLGLDATIKYGKKDLRIKNPYSFNLYINTEISGGNLNITLRSEKELPYRYEINTEEDEINLPFSNEKNKQIRPGLSILVYRLKYKGDKLLGSYLLYKDFFPPVIIE